MKLFFDSPFHLIYHLLLVPTPLEKDLFQ